MGLFSKRVKATQIRRAEELDETLARGKPVFVDFMKYDCQPCRIMDGIVDELADEFQDRAIVVRANLADVPALFTKFGVRSTPTFLLVSPGRSGASQRFRHSGLIKKDQLVAQIQAAVDTD